MTLTKSKPLLILRVPSLGCSKDLLNDPRIVKFMLGILLSEHSLYFQKQQQGLVLPASAKVC